METLREIRMRIIDDASTKIQATFRMHQTKSQLALFYKSVGRMQAAFRGIHYREKWCRYRQAISIVQWFFKGFILKNRYVTKSKAIRKLQAYFRKCHGRLRFMRIRRGLGLHGLSGIYVKTFYGCSKLSKLCKCTRSFLGLDVYIGPRLGLLYWYKLPFEAINCAKNVKMLLSI